MSYVLIPIKELWMAKPSQLIREIWLRYQKSLKVSMHYKIRTNDAACNSSNFLYKDSNENEKRYTCSIIKNILVSRSRETDGGEKIAATTTYNPTTVFFLGLFWKVFYIFFLMKIEDCIQIINAKIIWPVIHINSQNPSCSIRRLQKWWVKIKKVRMHTYLQP